MKRMWLWTLLFIGSFIFVTGVWGQAYPARPVRFIVPFPPGGANDVIARLLAVPLSEMLRQQFVIDNRGGANTIIGTDLTAKANPDGHTILIVPGSFAINVGLYKKLPYDSARDFAPVVMIGNGAYMVVVHPSLPVKSAAELIALVKQKPGEIRYASSGIGNVTHLAAEPSAAFLDVPPVARTGLPGYEVSGWYGILAPAGTPRAAIDALNQAVRAALSKPELKSKLLAAGVETVDTTPEQFRQFLLAEINKWGKVVRTLNITTE
ncbi:MAG: hypothetical protein HY322_03155 [Betaproteobacteria bacterium]|nr:hypothetical protein [Betaproteobacteria bacterium]